MIRKLVIGLTALALLAVNSSAQFYPLNSRIEALGGAFIVDDRSDIVRYPAYMNKYTDDAQLTFRNDSTTLKYSPIWAVKSLGKYYNIGVLANSGLMLYTGANGFYSRGAGTLSSNVTGTEGIPNDQNIPHLLFGLNYGALQFGFDLFVEYSRFHKEEDDNPVGPVARHNEYKATEYNPGGVVSLLFGTKKVPIAAKFGVGFPNISGLKDENGSSKVEISSKKGFFMDGGLEIGFPTGKLNWTAGTQLLFDAFQFQKNDTAISNKYGNVRWGNYLGFKAPVLKNGIFVLQYDFQWINNKDNPIVEGYAPVNRDTSYSTHEHIFSAGIEKPWTDAWIFDKFIFRTGLDYTIVGRTEHYDGSDANGDYDLKIRHETHFNQFNPHIGLGVTKSVFELDLTVNPSAWAGLISGPAVGTVTASVVF